MKTFNLSETRIPNLFYTEMYQKASQEIPENVVPQCYDSFFMSMANFCAMRKNKDKKIALIVRDLKNNFKMAMVVAFEEGKEEDTDNKGNWNVVITLDEKDVEDAEKYYTTDSQFSYTLATTTRDMHGFRYSQGEMVPKIIELIVELLLQWLEEEAKSGEEVVLELPGYFNAKVVVEGDKKIKGITPGENIKNVVKGDSEL